MIGVAHPSGEHVSGSRSARVLALAAAIALNVLALSVPAAASLGGLSVQISNPSASSVTINSGPTEFW